MMPNSLSPPARKSLEHAGIVADAKTLHAELAERREAQRRSAEQAAAEAILLRDAQSEVGRLDEHLAKLTADHRTLESEVRELDASLATERRRGRADRHFAS